MPRITDQKERVIEITRATAGLVEKIALDLRIRTLPKITCLFNSSRATGWKHWGGGVGVDALEISVQNYDSRVKHFKKEKDCETTGEES